MKKFLCLLLCLTLFASTAFAADITVPRKFRNQVITGGSGIKGTLSLTASGVADWLEYVLPFTATEMQVRIIGQAHGKYSESNLDDDSWQMRVYAEDADGNAQATTRLYGDPSGIYLTSDLVPDALLQLPVKNVQLPYALLEGEFASLFMALDPLGLLTIEERGNPNSYSALAELMQINDAQWQEKWTPVLDKYDTELEMWLAAYAAEPVVSGGTGAMTVKTTYRIPGEDIKAQAKKIIGMMLYDQELLALLIPHFTQAQQAAYLDPAMVYFYEFCVDALPLSGDVMLESELSALGENVKTSLSLPIPQLPQELTASASDFLAKCFDLPYGDVLANIDRVSYTKATGDITLSLSSPERTISFILSESATEGEAASLEGFVRVDPVAGSSEAPLAAAFAFKTDHAIENDENGGQHDDTTIAFSIEPDLSLVDEDDPFRSSYVDFAPMGVELSLNYYTKTPRAENTATRLQISAKVQLADAEIGLEADLRTTSSWALESLRTIGAENILTLSEERKTALLETLRSNAIGAMVQLSLPSVTEEPLPDSTQEPMITDLPGVATDTTLPEVEPTEVPPTDSAG